ncbi:hypothetical protein [Virgibacillus necropolis]|uniref:hypothetical protein n=1 Tax=Virgibacillus necropolis TaxID=163877 RepID=UPI0013747F3F|nr:hypothetical protein [Virgibacillus necropolis]
MMESFFNVLEDTKEKLGRKLQRKEVDFLQWMYERYQEEEKETCRCLKIENIN